MPSRLAAPVLTVNAGKMHKVDTRNVENLFGMWTVFSRCAESMEEGRRLENLSWRIWGRETLCCESQPQLTTTPPIDVSRPRPGSKDVPELSASVDSLASDEAERIERHRGIETGEVDIGTELLRRGSIESRSRGKEKHITSLGLEKMVISIKERKEIEPLSPSIADAVPSIPRSMDITPRPASPTTMALNSAESSASTALLSSPESGIKAVQTVGSDTSAELITSHSVVRGFSPSHISSSYRSQTHLSPEPLPVKSITHAKADEPKGKGGLFLLGASSGEDESSFEERMSAKAPRSTLAAGLKQKNKQTSFKDEVESRIIDRSSHEDEAVFESDDEEDISESAIDDEDDSSDWEDSASESGGSSDNEKQPLFQRVDSRPNLTSRRSLLTTLIHEPERAAALANQASRSTPAMHRSRTSSPNGPSIAASPEDEPGLTMQGPNVPGSKPIIMTTSNQFPPALSPRTTRRNMLATELTESLRKHLLWERQQKNTTANAVLKRRHTAHDVANLQEYPGSRNDASSKDASKNNSWNHYFDHGIGEYHQAGW
ncbi:MAG: hypothetical protein FRX48_02980 [Lasallia pustulata]|uniref:Uncharacterized protein n=1 Tax=Lasallia pustulata TaxID=136370 RepID=A0A5M8PV10_9LECA|nr:MAG: hypothetical protein FRX48_02980 [Lasallia pustulata]